MDDGREDSPTSVNFVDDLLRLDEISSNRFRSRKLVSGVPGTTRVYGGQVVAQSLMACLETVPHCYHPHSLHSYFVLSADTAKPIVYNVERIRDGRSIYSRHVRAVQDDKTIATCEVSLHMDEPDGIRQQGIMPNVPPPEQLQSALAVLENHFKIESDAALRMLIKKRTEHLPLSYEIRPVDPDQYLRLAPTKPRYLSWIKVNQPLGDDGRLAHVAAGFISDYCMVSTALLPYYGTNFKLALATSLNHAIWYHSFDFSMDDWLLYEVEGVAAGSSRTFVRGQFWSRDGTLLVSTAQEALIRGSYS